MGTGDIHVLLGVTLQWTNIPSRGDPNTLSCFMLQKPGSALAHVILLGLCATLPLITTTLIIIITVLFYQKANSFTTENKRYKSSGHH